MYSIRLEGDVRRLMKRLRKLQEVDIRRTGLVLAEALRTSTLERFKEQKGPDGKAWSTSIRASQENGSTLTDSARLKNSIKSTADGSGFAVGTNVIYARTHQFGEKGRSVTIRAKTRRGLIFKIDGRWIRKRQVKVNIKIPARPYLGISEEDMLEIKGTLEDALAEE
ncbi:phage virion morphogenesis protein [Paenibacillus melissococcoides]|uniref:phage virion morphogenesis protein n=1 Tax=Paenibacillus TaxID=44249 RepID=UPI001B133721|nr:MULTISPECIES: phage virion morphogenesis protein [Paenibacillus]MEB9894812.1 phage virion morphogenesis protein [Bacillus cereus]GIO82235.1 virion morphogenesis protein [Paenibacillus dendritiformis]CAH8721919.1 phage virion morphogenesis protein [Paenibacillus melissococcoides]CAH8721936.1 phage virion morphogenesis protein [Paenibacillus melissococcoides]